MAAVRAVTITLRMTLVFFAVVVPATSTTPILSISSFHRRITDETMIMLRTTIMLLLVFTVFKEGACTNVNNGSFIIFILTL